MRTLAIGDIHGCYKSLMTLLHAVHPASDDRLIFLGDYIDRGPDSRAVLEWLARAPKPCDTVFLRGNHEVMILDAREDVSKAHLWRSYGGAEMLASYSAEFRVDWEAAIPQEH